MTRIAVRSELRYEVHQPSSFFFSVEAASTEHQQIVSEELTASAGAELRRKEDISGNRLVAVAAQQGELTISYEAVVHLQPFIPPEPPRQQTPFADLPADVLTFLRPSRYCEADLLAYFAERTFGPGPTGFERVSAICTWIGDHVDYVAGSTGPTSTAVDVFTQRSGVCRDYAHLGITLCRAVGIPARYISGYAAKLEPPDFHGFFEAFLDGNWYLFDATQMARPEHLVRIGTGRDAADSAFATYTGSAELVGKDVVVTADDTADQTSHAVSTAGATLAR